MRTSDRVVSRALGRQPDRRNSSFLRITFPFQVNLLLLRQIDADEFCKKAQKALKGFQIIFF